MKTFGLAYIIIILIIVSLFLFFSLKFVIDSNYEKISKTTIVKDSEQQLKILQPDTIILTDSLVIIKIRTDYYETK
jgi:hypothetical protein